MTQYVVLLRELFSLFYKYTQHVVFLELKYF